jgi:hypothetical protein
VPDAESDLPPPLAGEGQERKFPPPLAGEGQGGGSDYSGVVRDSQTAILASAERITVVGRWVVLAAAIILNHFGNENSAASVFIVDTILFS